MKNTYQLNELLRAKQWVEFIALVTDFSIESFKQWQWSQNSTHYILVPLESFGLRYTLCSSVTNIGQTPIRKLFPTVFQSYVDARLQSAVDCVNDESLENPLEMKSKSRSS